MQGVCIYCGTQGEMSPEHYLPAALGDFGEFQVFQGRVCEACNQAIGQEVETQFLRTGPMALFRWILGIEGRDGEPPPPFYRGAGGAPPILVHGRPPGFDFDLLWEIEWATRNVVPARQIVFHDATAGKVPVLITDRMMADHTQLRPAVVARGIPDAIPHRLWAHPDEAATLEAMIQATYGQLPAALWEEAPDASGPIALNTLVQVGKPFFRAVAKIVFHYALKVFPDLDGSAPEFQAIREYVRHGAGDGFVRELPQQIIGNFHVGERPVSWSHILFVERDYFGVGGYAQFFVGPESLPFPLQIRIGGNPSRLALPRERQAHGYVIETVDGGGRPHGRVEDLHPATHIVAPR